jgi:c-di-GMP-binding flagellar brake protein YcgR
MVLLADLYHIGDRINIIRYRRKKVDIYPSQVLDILSNDLLMVSGPIRKSSIVIMHKGDIIGIECIVENKGRYIFRAEILNRYEKGVYKLEIRKISKIRRFQQRKFYRFSTSLPVKIIFNTKINDLSKSIEENCHTKDISGSGMKLLCNYKHSVGDIIQCILKLNDKTLRFDCEVVRIEETDMGDYKFLMGIKYINIKDTERDFIVKFIFGQERKLRKKGLI